MWLVRASFCLQNQFQTYALGPQGSDAAAGPWAVFLLALGADSSKPSFVNLTSGQVYIKFVP